MKVVANPQSPGVQAEQRARKSLKRWQRGAVVAAFAGGTLLAQTRPAQAPTKDKIGNLGQLPDASKINADAHEAVRYAADFNVDLESYNVTNSNGSKAITARIDPAKKGWDWRNQERPRGLHLYGASGTPIAYLEELAYNTKDGRPDGRLTDTALPNFLTPRDVKIMTPGLELLVTLHRPRHGANWELLTDLEDERGHIEKNAKLAELRGNNLVAVRNGNVVLATIDERGRIHDNTAEFKELTDFPLSLQTLRLAMAGLAIARASADDEENLQ